MLAVIVRTPSKMEEGMTAWFPATMTTAIVSPMARPTPRTTDAMIPENAAGTTMRKTERSCVAPRASAPS